MPEPRAQVPLEASRWDWAGGRVTTGDCFIWHLALFLQIAAVTLFKPSRENSLEGQEKNK